MGSTQDEVGTEIQHTDSSGARKRDLMEYAAETGRYMVKRSLGSYGQNEGRAAKENSRTRNKKKK